MSTQILAHIFSPDGDPVDDSGIFSSLGKIFAFLQFLGEGVTYLAMQCKI